MYWKQGVSTVWGCYKVPIWCEAASCLRLDSLEDARQGDDSKTLGDIFASNWPILIIFFFNTIYFACNDEHISFNISIKEMVTNTINHNTLT